MIVDLTPQIIADKENKTLNKPFRTPKGPKKFKTKRWLALKNALRTVPLLKVLK